MSGIERENIAPGVRFTSVRESKFKQNFLSVNFLLPLRAETASVNALVPMVLRRGCEGWPDMTALNRRLKELYGARLDGGAVKRGENQVVTLFCEVMSDRFALAGEQILRDGAGLLSSVIFRPALENGAFIAENVEIERRNLVDMIDAQLNEKRTYAINRLREEMCRDEAYGVNELGRREQAAAVTGEQLLDAWRTMLRRAPVEILFIGDADPEPCKALFAAAFKETGREELLPCGTRVVRQAGEPKNVTERLPISQAKLVMGFRTGVAVPDADVPALQLANTVFGGSPLSKLFANVREKMSLCYYCVSRFERLKGLLIVDSGIEQHNFEKARDEILHQLEDVRSGAFTDEELSSAALSLRNSYNEMADSLYALHEWYLTQAVVGTLQTPVQAAQEIARLGREDVVRAFAHVSLDTVYLLAGAQEGEEKHAV